MSSATSACLPPVFFLTASSAFIERTEKDSFQPEIPVNITQDSDTAPISATFSTIESKIEEIVFEVSRQREALKKRFALCLQQARDEAQEQSDLVPLTHDAEAACRDFCDWIADQYFYKRYLKLVATARLNGGAAFVAVHEKTGKRLDISFEPDGCLASIFLTDRKHQVARERFQKDPESWDRYIQWLFL